MRKRTLLIALAVIGLGLIGTGLSTLYKQNGQIDTTARGFTHKVSYGFPLGWYGYSGGYVGWIPFPEVYWFSLESFLLDTVFWFAISSIGCIATIKSMNILHKARAAKNLSVVNI